MHTRPLLAAALGAAVLPFASAAMADDVVILDNGDYLERYDTADETFRTFVVIKGLPEHREILAIDTRPQDGVLYGMTRERLYKLDPGTGWATPVGPAFRPMYGASLGSGNLDFDPVTGLARLVYGGSTTGVHREAELVLLDPDTGLLLEHETDDPPAVVYGAGDPGFGSLVTDFATAHDSNAAGATSTTFYGIDRSRSALVRIGPAARTATSPESGEVTTIGSLGIDSKSYAYGMEILPSGIAYTFVFSYDNSPMRWDLYRIDLATGAATLERSRPSNLAFDLAAAPAASGSLRVLDVTKAALSFRYDAAGRDVVELRGTLPAPVGGWKGKTVRSSIAQGLHGTRQLHREFVLDRHGRSRTVRDADGAVLPRGSFVVSKAKRGVVKFTMKLSRESYPVLLFQATTPSGPVKASVDLLVDGVAFSALVDLNYVASTGRGVATMVP